MLSGMLEQLLGAYPALLFLVILAGHHSCSATTSCAPSSCGDITYISYPFRLETDPISCGLKKYELGCENNRTTVYLQRVKYYVQAIDYYPNFTIRLVEADFQKDDYLSIPRHSSYSYNYSHYYPFRYSSDSPSFTLTFLSCPSPIPSPPFNFVNTSSCKNGSTYSPSFRHMEGYSYVMVSYDWMVDDHYMMVGEIAEVPDLCRIDLTYDAPLYFQQFENITNMSLIEVHDILAYGFGLSWFEAACDYGKENHLNLDNATTRYIYYCGRNRAPIRAAIAFLVNRILAYLSIWRLKRYLPDGSWIYYVSFGKPQLVLNYYKGNGTYTTKTISSDFLSILIVLLITLLVLLVLIGKFF